MTTQDILTVMSGIVLLLVFLLVGRNLRRRHDRDDQASDERHSK